MNLSEESKIELLKAVLGDKVSPSSQSPFIGKHVLVRTYSAGVHVGILEKQEGETVLLKDAHRIWKWSDAFTLSEVATKGIGNQSRVSCAVPYIELDRIEIIPISEQALKTVKENVE